MKIFFRVALLLLLCALLTTGIHSVAFAYVVTTGDYVESYASGSWGNLKWDLDMNGLLVISGSGDMDDFTENSTEAWHKELNYIRSVVILEGVNSISRYAFTNCANMTYASILSKVTSIGDGAFYGCSGLTDVTIPSSVTSIGHYAFADCSGLTNVTIPLSVTSIGYYAFYGCSGLTDVTIPSSVTSIGRSTFQNCSGLTNVTIPSSVTSIGHYAFDDCSGLTDVTIPSSVTSVGFGAFWGCSGLNAVYINDIAAWCEISFQDDISVPSNPLYYAQDLYLY